MRRHHLSRALAVLTAFSALLITGCATLEDRISQNPQIFNSLSPRDQALIRQGQIREGMGQDAVWLAWGAPDNRLSGRSRGRPAETWIYNTTTTAYAPHYGFGIGYYGGYGGGFRHRGHHRYRHFGYYDPFYDPFFYSHFQTISYPYKIVSFQNGRVVGFQFLQGRGAPADYR